MKIEHSTSNFERQGPEAQRLGYRTCPGRGRTCGTKAWRPSGRPDNLALIAAALVLLVTGCDCVKIRYVCLSCGGHVLMTSQKMREWLRLIRNEGERSATLAGGEAR